MTWHYSFGGTPLKPHNMKREFVTETRTIKVGTLTADIKVKFSKNTRSDGTPFYYA